MRFSRACVVAGLAFLVPGTGAAQAISDAAEAAGIRVPALIDLDVGQQRTGVLPGGPALALAREVGRMPGLRLVGVQGYEGHLQHVEQAERRRER